MVYETCPVAEPCDSCCPEITCSPCPTTLPTSLTTHLPVPGAALFLWRSFIVATSLEKNYVLQFHNTHSMSKAKCFTMQNAPSGNVENVQRTGCGRLTWSDPDLRGEGLTYKIRFYYGTSYGSTDSSQKRILTSETNSLNFTAVQVPTARPLFTIVSCFFCFS